MLHNVGLHDTVVNSFIIFSLDNTHLFISRGRKLAIFFFSSSISASFVFIPWQYCFLVLDVPPCLDVKRKMFLISKVRGSFQNNCLFFFVFVSSARKLIRVHVFFAPRPLSLLFVLFLFPLNLFLSPPPALLTPTSSFLK